MQGRNRRCTLKLTLAVSLIGWTLLGVSSPEAKPRSCTGDYNKCMNDCPVINAEAKNPKLATEACQNNCGRQWANCSYSGRDDGSLKPPDATSNPVQGGTSGTATQP